MNRDERIVVIGGGLTGLRAAERLRELKFEGDITILGDEKLPPYHRPALSKQLLQGSLRPSDLTLPAYEDLNARWRFGTQVRQLIPNKKTLVLPGGEEMTYDGLIIATGVEATRQSGVPYHDPRVLVLRTMSDGLDLERVIGSTKGRVAVIGGGFTGCELAASLRYLSREVTLIGRGKNLLGNVLGPDLGEWLTKEHRDHGVDLALGNSVEEWNPTAEGIGLKLTDGSTVMVSCVILAAGTKPMTHWLRGSGLPLDNGVVCEPTCHVVGADDVVAAGDVAQWPNLRFDNVPRRVEHWLNAVEMGRAAAENLLAGRANSEPFTPMPRFWTDQYSYRIQAAGMIKLGKDIVKLGTPDEGTGTVYGYSLEGRLMAVAGVDCPSAMIAWAESVSRQNPEPRPRVEVDTQTKTPVTAGAVSGGFAKKRPGKHSAPPQEKQFQVQDRPEPEIGFTEQPVEVGAPVGVGAGVLPGGRPRNPSDSFSRMLPVAVRPPNATGPQSARPPVPLLGGRTMPGAGPFPPANQSGPLSRPPAGGPPIGSTSGAFANGSTSGAFPRNGAPVNSSASGVFPRNGAPANGSTSGAFANGSNGRSGNNGAPLGSVPLGGAPFGIDSSQNGGGQNGRPRNGVPTNPFGAPPKGRLLLGPATGPVPAHDNAPPRVPQFSAAELTDVGGVPPIDVTGEMPPLDANGNVRTPEFSDVPPAARSFTNVPAVARGGDGGRVRGPEESFSRMPAVRGPQDSFNSMPPARRGSDDSYSALPPARRQDSYSSLPPARRGSDDSFSAMPPARRGSNDSYSALPPARRGSSDSYSALPPARRQDSYSSLPPAGRGSDDSFSAMQPARRGSDDSFSAMQPARRGSDDSYSAMQPARRGSDDSFSSMPPARRGSDDSFSAMPPARRAEASSSAMPPAPAPTRRAEASASAMPPVRRSDRHRGAADSFSAMPPARPGLEESLSAMPPVRRRADRHRGAEDSFSAMPPASRAEASSSAMPPARRSDRHRGADDSYSSLPPASRSTDSPRRGDSYSAQDSYSALPPSRRQDSYSSLPPATRSGGRRRRAEDSYSAMPAVETTDVAVTSVEATAVGDTFVQGGRRASHRAEDTPEFGRPSQRHVDQDLSSLRLVPALSSMEDPIDMPPTRMPKHGRPEDYGVPSSRPGPEDSYDRMAPARAAGGRRRARA